MDFRKGHYNYCQMQNLRLRFCLDLELLQNVADKHLLYTGLNVDLTRKNIETTTSDRRFVERNIGFPLHCFTIPREWQTNLGS